MSSKWQIEHKDDIDEEWISDTVVEMEEDNPSAMAIRRAADEKIGAEGWPVVEAMEVTPDVRIVVESDIRGHLAILLMRRLRED